jgi:hypothetical protein
MVSRLAPATAVAGLVALVAGCGGGGTHGVAAATDCLKRAGFHQVGLPKELNSGLVPLQHELTVAGGVIDVTRRAADAAKLAHDFDVGTQAGGPASVKGNVVVHGANGPLSPAERSVRVPSGAPHPTASANPHVAAPSPVETKAQAIRACATRLGIDVEHEALGRNVPAGSQDLGLFPPSGGIAGDIDVFADPAAATQDETVRRSNPYFAGVVRSGDVVLAYAAPLSKQAAALKRCL